MRSRLGSGDVGREARSGRRCSRFFENNETEADGSETGLSEGPLR